MSQLTAVHPKIPMRNKSLTRAYYIDQLGFKEFGGEDFPGYLMVQRDEVEIHFFEYPELDPEENYGGLYIRVKDIDAFYQELRDRKVIIHPNGALQIKSWGQKEFSLLDPDMNIITFGEGV